MRGVVARKLLAVIPVLLAVSFLTFLMMNLLPGCVECQILGPDAMDEQAVVTRSCTGDPAARRVTGMGAPAAAGLHP
ncbi:MAG: hypothetical protein ACRD07_13545 [Acidimicrobiales bacterium]